MKCNFVGFFFKEKIEIDWFLLNFVRKRFEDHTVFPMHESHAIMSDSKFDHKKKTVLYIHGYVEAPSHQSIHVIVDAYLTRDDYNCLVLDWSELADGNFFVDAVPNIKQVNNFID